MKNKFPLIIALTVFVFFIQAILVYRIGIDSLSSFLVRVFALWGYTSMSFATISTPYINEIRKRLGVVFLKVHHTFAAFGIAFISLHPITLALKTSNIMVFIPSFESWYKFWLLAGRPALIIIYVAVMGVYLRKRIPGFWRFIHALMYIALLMGIVHGNMIGSDFNSLIIKIFFNLLFILSSLVYILKRK